MICEADRTSIVVIGVGHTSMKRTEKKNLPGRGLKESTAGQQFVLNLKFSTVISYSGFPVSIS